MKKLSDSLHNIKGSIILTLASFIWGLAFVVQAAVVDKITPMWFNGIRSFIGVLAISLFLCIRSKVKQEPIFPKEKDRLKRTLLAGLFCGILLTLSVNLQQWGLALYPEGVPTEARGGFITALYVILVPLVSVLFGKKISLFLTFAVVLAMGGIYLLCGANGIKGFYFADVIVFSCAVSFTGHILVVDRFGKEIDGFLLSAMQFLVCGTFSCIGGAIFEGGISGATIASVLPELLYMGIISSGIAYTLQIVGQKFAEPTVASICMSLESVFSALGGWLIAGNTLSLPETVGCVLVFGATVLAQITPKKKREIS